MTSEREVIATAEDLRALEQTHTIVHVEPYVVGLVWWRRAAVWLFWRTPARVFVRRRFLSPYAVLRAIVVPPSTALETEEARIADEAARVLASDKLSREPDPEKRT